jgi:dTDP-4-dehydrorhamnose reductase
VDTSLDLLIDGEQGIWHLANTEAISWVDLARLAASIAGISGDGIKERLAATFGFIAKRPRYSVLGSERGMLMPSLESALSRYWCAVELDVNRRITPLQARGLAQAQTR